MKRLGSLCKFVHMHIPPKQKNIQGAFPPSVPLLTATAVRLEPAPALHMPTNRSFGLRSWCAAPRPSAVLCSKDHMGMSLLHRRCVQLELCAVCADRPPDADRQQHTSDVGRCKSSLGSTCPVSPRHIPSQTHSPQLTARISAGFFSPPTGIAGAMTSGRLVGHGSANFTCG